MIRFVFALAAVLAFASTASAVTYTAGPSDDVERMINMLGPGDELVLDDGMYVITERFSFDIAGTRAMPIVIRAAAGATPHFHRPNASQNIWDIDNAIWVEIRGLEFSGGSAGLRFSGGTNVTLADCEIHDTGDVAVRANDSGVLYDGFRILRNDIHHTNDTGEGMYLGCNNDGCRMANSLIEGNYVHHTNQASVRQGDGIELKEGSYNNIIRDNVIHDTNYPCILTYGTVGNGAPNIIERNVMWNCGDHGIQSASDAIIRNNIILGSGSDGIACQMHQSGSPSNMEIVHNTVLHANNDALAIRDISGRVLVANNALYARSGRSLMLRGMTGRATVAGNVGVGSTEGVPSGGWTMGNLGMDVVMGHYMGAPPIDVYPAAGGGLVGSGAAMHVAMDDFNGTARMGQADVGAYRFDMGGNPGWTIRPGFRDSTGGPPPMRMDGGVTPGRDGGGPPPDTDGGATGGRDGAVGGDGGGTTGGDAGDGDGAIDGGCDCRVSTGGANGATLPLAIVALGLLALRRRQSRSRRSRRRSTSVRKRPLG